MCPPPPCAGGESVCSVEAESPPGFLRWPPSGAASGTRRAEWGSPPARLGLHLGTAPQCRPGRTLSRIWHLEAPSKALLVRPGAAGLCAGEAARPRARPRAERKEAPPPGAAFAGWGGKAPRQGLGRQRTGAVGENVRTSRGGAQGPTFPPPSCSETALGEHSRALRPGVPSDPEGALAPPSPPTLGSPSDPEGTC